MSSVVLPGRPSEGRRQQSGVRSTDLRRFLKGLIFLLVIILVLQLGFHFFLSPRIRITDIEINVGSAFPYQREEILALAGLDGDLSFFSVDTDSVEARFRNQAAVKQVTVRKKFPGTLIVDISERKPFVSALVNSRGRTVPVVFCSEGVAFQIGKSVTDWNLPVVSGLEFDGVQLGMRLPREMDLFLEQLSELRSRNPAMFSLISEMEFSRNNTVDYEVILYPSFYDTKVRIGLGISEELLNYILITLDTIRNEPSAGEWRELDFRSDVPVYRIGEG